MLLYKHEGVLSGWNAIVDNAYSWQVQWKLLRAVYIIKYLLIPALHNFIFQFAKYFSRNYDNNFTKLRELSLLRKNFEIF